MKLGPRGEGWVGAQVALLLLFLFGPCRGGSRNPGLRLLGVLLGLPLLVTGGVFGFYGFKTLGSSLTPFPRPKVDSQLVTEGIYACVRHPIYTGVVMAAVGIGLLSGSPGRTVLGLVLLPFFGAKASVEEEWLRERYPDYVEYEQRVRKILPGIW